MIIKDQIKYPYPSHLISQHKLLDGTLITIRPTSSDDAKIIKEFSGQAGIHRCLKNHCFLLH